MTNSPFKSTKATSWDNFHKNLRVPIKDMFTVRNPSGKDAYAQYNEMTHSIQSFMGAQMANKTTMKPFGSGWSWTGVNTSENGVMLDTSSNFNKGMNLVFDLDRTSVANEYHGDPHFLVLCQCGIRVRKLNKYLEKTKRSLKTSGASDGQTIVGALSTGTHGSNLAFGAIADFVVGMHIITGPNENDHVWIERESYPVLSQEFLTSLKMNSSQLIKNDDVFNSALVNIGGFGFIHSILVETEEIYQMRLIRQQFNYDDKLVKLMTTQNVKDFGFPDYNGEELNHLQVVLDPYKFDATAKTGVAIVTYGYKLPTLTALHQKPNWFRKLLFMLGIRYNKVKRFFRNLFGGLPNDLVHLLAGINETIPALIPATVEEVLKLSYKLEDQKGTLGDLFTGEGPPSALAGSTMCVDPIHIERVLQIFQKRTPRHSPEFAGIYSLRFVKSSEVTLAGNHFGAITCAIEADGILNQRTDEYYANIWSDLRAQGIPFRFHLGKLNDLDATKFSSMYGESLTKWNAARNKVLNNPDVRNLYQNSTLKSWGLS